MFVYPSMICHKKLILSAIITLLLISSSMAQKKDLGSWTILNVKADLRNKWSLQSELQLRSLSVYKAFFYYEAQAGLSYAIENRSVITLGTG